MFRSLFHIILIPFLLIPVAAYGFKHISTPAGLSHKRTFSVLKDKEGFIWFATRDGIDRYDGRNMKQYKLLDKTQTINFAGRINKLVSDDSLNLWVFSTYGQVFQYIKEEDRYHLQVDFTEKIEDTDFYMYGMTFMDQDHFFVFGSFGLYLYNIPQEKLTRLESTQNRYVSGVVKMEGDRYALSTRTGLCLADLSLLPDGGIEEKFYDTTLKERTKSIYYEKSDNSLIIGTYNGYIYRYDCQAGTVSAPLHRLNASVRDIDCHNQIIYIATDGQGITRLNRNTLELYSGDSYFGLTEQDSRLNFLYDIFIDENRLWIATYNDGIFVYDKNLPDFRFTQVYHRNDNFAGAGNTINSILEDSRGYLWVASNYGVRRYDSQRDEWKYVSDNKAGHSILSLCEDKRGYIWAGGGSQESAICIDPQTLQPITRLSFPNDFANVSSGRIYCVYSGSGGDLWFGGIDCNLTRYNPVTREEKHYPVMFVNCIVEHNRALYIGTTHGLYIYDKANDTFTPYAPMQRAGSPVRKFINCIYIDEQTTLWLGTEGGLIRCAGDSVKVYDNSNGLESDYVQAILPDSRKRLWLSTSNGLVCLDPQSETITKFGAEEGLHNDIFKNRSAIRNRKGEFMFGTAKGILQFIPEHIDRPNVHNKMVFTHFEISGKPVYAGRKDSPLENLIDKVSTIHLKHKQNTFTLGFVNINYTNPYNTRLEWKLEGYDKEWITRKTATEAYYTNVPPGKYKFMLRLLDRDNGEEIGSRTLDIDIHPPFWNTPVSRLIYLLLLMGLVWGIIQFIGGRMKVSATVEKMRFFVNTSHELKTPITLIKGPLDKLNESPAISGEDKMLLELATTNTDRLNNLVSQLLDMQKNQSGRMRVALSRQEISGYISRKIRPFEQSALRKNINLTLTVPEASLEAWIDLDKMDKILNNLLSNAVKYTLPEGDIQVKLGSDRDEWYLEVSDNGIGIPEKAQKNIFKPFFRAENVKEVPENGMGIGLLYTRQLISQLGGKLTFTSKENRGTTFRFTLPCGYAHLPEHSYILEDDPPLQSEEGLPEEERQPGRSSILIVEDNAELRQLIRQVLADKYQIHEAENGIDALEQMKVSNPELIISDIMMPAMNGYDLCREVKLNKETSHIPVILLSVLDEKKDIRKGYELGADNYITKPFEPSILRMTVENTISTRQALRKNLVLPLVEVEQEAEEEELTTNPLDKAFIDEVISVIDKNINDIDFSIRELCREMAMSRSSFYNKLKILTGESPNGFIRLVRLNRAAKLLSEKRYASISDVSYAVGIGDVKYFSTIFKKQFGISPSRYGK